MAFTTEAELEAALLADLETLGYAAAHGSGTAPDADDPLRGSWREAILGPVLRAAVARLNPALPAGAVEDVVAKISDRVFPDLAAENRRLHGLIVHGVPVEYQAGGESVSALARLVDWGDALNDWRAINQVTIVGRTERIPDVILYLNGLPLVPIELKGLEGKDVSAAFQQIETYKADIPELFRTALFSVISDGWNARYGTISADLDRFMRWRTVDGKTLVDDKSGLGLEVLTHGLLAPGALLSMLRWFTVFEDDGRGPIKKVAGYHQFHAVKKAVEAVSAARAEGSGKAGVIWHTQGSGKSLLMAFLGGRLMRDPAFENPTLLVITDRNDLDDQLFGTFGRCKELLGEEPKQAASIDDEKNPETSLVHLLRREVGGVVFSTMQKFRPAAGEEFPTLTERSNVIVMVDEAHRTQYGFEAKLDKETGELRRGLAHHLRKALPNAVYVAFTGTPVELVGADTRAVFGDYIDIYDISRAVKDGATVPIYYEGRVAKIELDEEALEEIDDEFEDATEDLEDDQKTAAAKKWSRVEALVGAKKRLDAVVEDILRHFDARLVAMDGKAMIVCMSRRICAEVYQRIVAARPDWHGETDDEGAVKVVMTGSATDPAPLQPHIRSKTRQQVIQKRFKDVKDPLKLVIVRDMWLTGFDAPCMHTLYVDKPMKGHGLMQAIARVNRVFRDKPAGLVVDYIGLATELKSALAHYSQDDRAETGIDERQAVEALLNGLDVARGYFHGFDYATALKGDAPARVKMLPKAVDFIIGKAHAKAEDGDLAKACKPFADAVAALAKAFKLAGGSAEASANAVEVAFFIAVRAGLDKLDVAPSGRRSFSPDFAIEQLINRAVASTEVVDILEACGFDRPDISVLSDDFLLELQGMEHRNLAVEALKKLLNGEISARLRTNVVQQEEFSNRLSDAVKRYHNRSVDVLQVIQELIELARDLKKEPEDGLTADERAFYDALAKNESAAEVMSNEELRIIAAELVNTIRNTSGTDWWKRENVRGKMRVAVKRILKRHGYPPDLQAEAVRRVLRQAEAMAAQL